MPRQTTGGLHESNANIVIAQWMNSAGHKWTASGEPTNAIADNSRERPDIVITEGGRMPVIVECEYDDSPRPAIADAQKRLGKTLVGETRPFTEVIAIGIAAACKNDSDEQFRWRLENNEVILTIQLVSQDDASVKIWPDQPLPATPNDLVAYCEYAQVPQAVIDRESAAVAQKVDAAGQKLLSSIEQTSAALGTLAALRRITGCSNDKAASLTAVAIWLIAIDLQNDLAQYSANLRAHSLQTTDGLKQSALLGRLTSGDILTQWRIIAAVNYLPVIELAIDTLTAGTMGNELSDVLEHLHNLSDQLNALHAKHIYNFAGELWQRIVPDREERAAHYTRPEIAELLATLAAARFDRRNPQQLAKST